MNTSYLLSVLDLYLLKEKNGKVVIEVSNTNDVVKVSFSYTFDHTNQTFVKIDKNLFISCIKEFIAKIQGNLDILKEESNQNNKGFTTFTFSDGRRISFANFNDSDLKIIKSSFTNANFQENVVIKEEVNVKAYDDIVIEDFDEEPEEKYEEILNKTKKTKFAFSLGFTSYVTLFIMAVWFLDIFMIALWIFKAFSK